MSKELPKFKDPKEMSKKDLRYWLNWAQEEMMEYQDLIQELMAELKKRK